MEAVPRAVWLVGGTPADVSSQVTAMLASAPHPSDPMEKAITELAGANAASGTDRRLIRTYGLGPKLLAMSNVWQLDGAADCSVLTKGAPETVASLSLNHMGNCRVGLLKAAIPLTNDAEFFPGVQKSWSLAFQINNEPVFTGRPAGGLMWAGLANSYYWIDPATGVGGVYATQIFPFADVQSVPLYYAFETAVYDSLR